jgi:beta-lactamase class A
MRVFALSVLFLVGCVSAPKQTNPFAKIEDRVGGRIGVFAINTKTGTTWQWRPDERFLMCSTFKVLLAAHVLSRVDAGLEKLERPIAYAEKDLLAYAPVTRANLKKKQLSVQELAAAAVQLSDNTAANLLFRTQDGPRGLTHYLKGIGDAVTRSDRTEPELNQQVPGQEFDTTSPRAMVASLRAILLESKLSPNSTALLKNWLLTNTTSAKRFKAGLPADWQVADKTGTGGSGNVNDVGLLHTPDGTPIVIAVFTSDSVKPVSELEAALADVAKEISQGPM